MVTANRTIEMTMNIEAPQPRPAQDDFDHEATKRDLIVYVVEDDEAMRTSISGLLTGESIKHRLYESPQNFLEEFSKEPGVLLLDLRLPGINGIELYKLLRDKGVNLPFIMISGNASIQNAVDSMRLGAVDFLEKPFRSQALLEAIAKAFQTIAKNKDICRRLGLLSAREMEFLGYIKEGLSVKSISHQLNISPKTGHAHRRSIHQKMGVDSDAYLVKMLQQMRPTMDQG